MTWKVRCSTLVQRKMHSIQLMAPLAQVSALKVCCVVKIQRMQQFAVEYFSAKARRSQDARHCSTTTPLKRAVELFFHPYFWDTSTKLAEWSRWCKGTWNWKTMQWQLFLKDWNVSATNAGMVLKQQRCSGSGGSGGGDDAVSWRKTNFLCIHER